jgi:hypothetical protein
MFDLKRPCANCPFRIGQGRLFRMEPGRLAGIFQGPAFQCHKTLLYDDDGEGVVNGPKAQQCAGLMAILHREGQASQIMQVAERFGRLDPATLDPEGEAYASIAEAMAAHGGAEP